MEQIKGDFADNAIEAARWFGREWPAFIHFGALAALAAAQGWLAWEFWGDFTSDPNQQSTLRAVGLGLVGMEVVGLQMASRAASRGEDGKARTWRGAWAAFALLNLSIDVSAISKLLQEGGQAQAEALAEYEARDVERRGLQERIDRADDPFSESWLGSIAAYDTAIDAKQAEIASRPHAGERWHGARLRELGELQTARAVAVQIAAWETRRDALELEGEGAAAPPQAGAEFQSLEFALDKIPGVDVTPEQIRNSLALGLALSMKLALTLAAWVGMAAQPASGAASNPLPAPSNDHGRQGEGPSPPPIRRDPPKRGVQFRPVGRR